jgi:hypothetical protein
MASSDRNFRLLVLRSVDGLFHGTSGVSVERRRARVRICCTCDECFVDVITAKCAACGCKLQNIARHEETATHGCKHEDGSKWKAAGV